VTFIYRRLRNILSYLLTVNKPRSRSHHTGVVYPSNGPEGAGVSVVCYAPAVTAGHCFAVEFLQTDTYKQSGSPSILAVDNVNNRSLCLAPTLARPL